MRVTIVKAGIDRADELVNVLIKSYGMGEELREAAYDAIKLHLEVEPRSCYEAIVNDVAVGMACYVNYGELAWVGFVGVIPGYRRRGIGTELMVKLMSDLRGKGVRTLRLDATEEGERLYSKLGFKHEYATLMYGREGEIRKSVTKSLSRVRVADVMPPWVIALDREAFGAYRVKAINARLRRGGRVLMIKNEGYALIYRDVVGPVVAVDPKVAEELIRAALIMGASKIVVPEANKEAVRIVESLSFKPKFKCYRMRYGDPARESVNITYGILSLDKG